MVEGLRERGLPSASLISIAVHGEPRAGSASSRPALRRGWSVPRVRRDYTRSRAGAGAYAVLRCVARGGCPARPPRGSRAGDCEALMAHRMLVSAALVARGARRRRAALRVDGRRRRRGSRALEALGVDGVITNDPRLFDDSRGLTPPDPR